MCQDKTCGEILPHRCIFWNKNLPNEKKRELRAGCAVRWIEVLTISFKYEKDKEILQKIRDLAKIAEDNNKGKDVLLCGE